MMKVDYKNIEDAKRYLPRRENEAISFQSLSSRSMNVVVDNFNELCQKPNNIPPKLFVEILESLTCDKLDIDLSAEFVHNEDFWKRSAMDTFGNGKCVIESHGLSWKRLYYEMYLSDLLSRIEEAGGADKIIQTAKSIKDYIFTLTLNGSYQDENFLSNLFKCLPNLTSLTVRNDFKARSDLIGDMTRPIGQIGNALNNLKCLCSLTLSTCGLDDDLIRLLLIALNEGGDADGDIRNTLVHLDLSHNGISTNGLRLILDHFLIPNDTRNDPTLATLNIANNNIRIEGGRSIGRMLRTNTSLTSLDVSLNRLEDEGGELLIQGLRQNCTVQYLNMASNELGSKSVTMLSKVLEEDDPSSSLLETNHICVSELEEIDLCSNRLSDADVLQLSKSMKINKKLLYFDLRCQRLMKDDEKLHSQPSQVFERAIASINENLLRNENERFSK